MSNSIILIIDDTPDNLSQISALLKDKYKVKVATNGSKGISIANTDPKPNLILLDIMMPEMDGYEVCKTLKSQDSTKNIPVVYLSGKSDPKEIEEAMSMGAQGYLVKPVEPDLLFQTIEPFL